MHFLNFSLSAPVPKLDERLACRHKWPQVGIVPPAAWTAQRGVAAPHAHGGAHPAALPTQGAGTRPAPAPRVRISPQGDSLVREVGTNVRGRRARGHGGTPKQHFFRIAHYATTRQGKSTTAGGYKMSVSERPPPRSARSRDAPSGLRGMAILAMTGHGQDPWHARDLCRAQQGWAWAERCSALHARGGHARVAWHGHPGHDGARAGCPWHAIAAARCCRAERCSRQSQTLKGMSAPAAKSPTFTRENFHAAL